MIRAELTNRTTTFYPPYPKKLIDSLTSFSVPNAYFMPLFNRLRHVTKIIDGHRVIVQERIWDGRKHLLNKKTRSLSTGLWLSIRQEMLEHSRVYLPRHYNDKRLYASNWYRFENHQAHYLKTLIQKRFAEARYFQVEACIAMLRSSNCGGLILQATGSGKTYLAAMLFTMLYDVDCLFVVDELTLLHQARKELQNVTGEEIGYVGEGEYKTRRITVATIQTLDIHKHDARFEKWLQKIDVLVLDELHKQMARRNFSVVETLQPSAIYGLTATLELRKKHVRLRACALCGPVLYEYPYEKGAKEKVLAQGIVVRVLLKRSQPIHKGSQWYRFDYDKCIVNSKRRNNLVEMLVRACEKRGRKTIALVERVEHLKKIYRRLEDLYVEKVWGGRKSAERVSIQDKFEKGDVRVIVANKVFETGINIKSVDTGIDASASKSANKSMQKFGRFVRQCPGKKFALFFDIADVGNRFEEAARIRLRTFRANKVPVITESIDDEILSNSTAFDLWLASVMKNVERRINHLKTHHGSNQRNGSTS